MAQIRDVEHAHCVRCHFIAFSTNGWHGKPKHASYEHICLARVNKILHNWIFRLVRRKKGLSFRNIIVLYLVYFLLMNQQTEIRFEYDTYSCMRDHHVAGAVVALLPNFVQPIFGLWIIGECINHVGGVVLYGCRAALHSARLFACSFFLSFNSRSCNFMNFEKKTSFSWQFQ